MESLANEIINKIIFSESINFDEGFNIIKTCSRLMINDDTEYLARRIVIFALDNWSKFTEEIWMMWGDLIEAIGFYPYLEKYNKIVKIDNIAAEIRKEYFCSNNLEGKYLHEEQKKVLMLLESNNNVILSAPTSFGKSLLIEELVASQRYLNILVIQPTIALLDETRRKMKKYEGTYKIIVKTSQTPAAEKGNLFLLTAERVMEYDKFMNIDLLILDEFYKISNKRDDERSDILNNAFNILLGKFNPKFYLLGPNIDGVSKGFAEKYNAVFYKTDYSLVENVSINYYEKYVGEFGDSGKAKEFKEQKLFELLYMLRDEQTIIYCSSPAKVRRLSKLFKNYLIQLQEEVRYEKFSLIQWVEENISKDWSFIECLKYGIGIHDGALQKHITSSVINYFNDRKLKFLFCTSTIIEGVNTSAKNVIYFDHTKGGKDNEIDYFDYSNIKGRSGRMMEHLIGNVYNFNKVPEKKNIVIDIPFFEQNPISDEVLINLKDMDVSNANRERYEKLQSIPEELKEIFKSNGVSIIGQIRIYMTLVRDIYTKNNLISWAGYPTYYQLYYVIELAWNNLIKDGESIRPMTLARLVKVTYDYGLHKNIMLLVHNNYQYRVDVEKSKRNPKKTPQDILDEAIQESFQIMRHWFEYKIPKWLNVVNSIQEYVCNMKGVQKGGYSFYASQLENDFIRDNLAILIECGIPRSAINKISVGIPEDIPEDRVQQYIKQNDVISKIPNLIQYEKDKLQGLIKYEQ